MKSFLKHQQISISKISIMILVNYDDIKIDLENAWRSQHFYKATHCNLLFRWDRHMQKYVNCGGNKSWRIFSGFEEF